MSTSQPQAGKENVTCRMVTILFFPSSYTCNSCSVNPENCFLLTLIHLWLINATYKFKSNSTSKPRARKSVFYKKVVLERKVSSRLKLFKMLQVSSKLLLKYFHLCLQLPLRKFSMMQNKMVISSHFS